MDPSELVSGDNRCDDCKEFKEGRTSCSEKHVVQSLKDSHSSRFCKGRCADSENPDPVFSGEFQMVAIEDNEKEY